MMLEDSRRMQNIIVLASRYEMSGLLEQIVNLLIHADQADYMNGISSDNYWGSVDGAIDWAKAIGNMKMGAHLRWQWQLSQKGMVYGGLCCQWVYSGSGNG